jgi:hypothetical protein
VARSNRERVGLGLDLLYEGLRDWVKRELVDRFGTRWWSYGVEPYLSDLGRSDVYKVGSTADDWWERIDLQGIINLMWRQWNEVFGERLGPDARSYLNELRTARNHWAHQKAFTNDQAYRALETMRLFLQSCGIVAQQEAVGELASEVLRIKFEQEMAKRSDDEERSLVTASETPAYLKPWREVVTPRRDVREGSFVLSEYAADLHQVHIGKASEEYGDPREFFHRTFITRGLKELLVGAVRRLSGQKVNPVLQLKTSFGGGKTHSLIALYHLFSGSLTLKDNHDLAAIADEAGVTFIPKASRAVIVGTMLDATRPVQKPDGTVVRTLWGELAWQLGGAEGYEYVRTADESSTAPGADTLVQLLDEFSPALILIDEFVAYARNIRGKEGLPAGTYDSLLTFLQALTEAVARAEAALLVVSLPESATEQGAEGGRDAQAQVENVLRRSEEVLSSLQHTLGRVEALWRPADMNESFEIVRRRLFEPIEDEVARGQVVEAFHKMYRDNPTLFPSECSESDYRNRLLASYPIHTEVFDRLYREWSSLERFQQTRGVLRLMAYIVNYLWTHDDRSLMILPSSIPIGDVHVREEFRRYVGDEWAAVFDNDIDGIGAVSYRLDSQNQSFGRFSAARRVARTIFLGSSPSRDEAQRGLTMQRIRLGTTMPGETLSTFKDAVDALMRSATYLYSDGDRYWFKTQPSVNRVAQKRAESYDEDLVLDWICEEMQDQRDRFEFKVHFAIDSPGSVPDEDQVRIVFLSPRHPHRSKGGYSEALELAQRILVERANGPRINRNMLVFVAADADRLDDLIRDMRLFRAWSQIRDEMDSGTLNLDQAQMRQVRQSYDAAKREFEMMLVTAYTWLIVPRAGADDDFHSVELSLSRLSVTGDLVGRVIDRVKRDEVVLTQLGAERLQIDLQRWIWKNSEYLNLQQVWSYFSQYLYLPKIKDAEVFLGAVRNAVTQLAPGPFAFAAGYDEKEGRYLDLLIDQSDRGTTPAMTREALLVRADVAAAQRKKDLEQVRDRKGDYETGAKGKGPQPPEPPNPPVRLGPKWFSARKKLNIDRLVQDVDTVATEIVDLLLGPGNGDVELVLEVRAKFPDPVDDKLRRDIEENCRTLRVDDYRFE